MLNPLDQCQSLAALSGLGLRTNADVYSDEQLHLSLILLSAWGVERISHINDQSQTEWGLLLDTTRRPDGHTLDQYLETLIAQDEIGSETTIDQRLGQIRPNGLIDQAQQASLRYWAEADLLVGDIWYYDGHVIEYTGKAAIGKTRHGTKQTSVKAVNRYTLSNGFCSLSEYFPVSVTYANALRTLLQKAQQSLPPDLQIRKLSFDREGWDTDLLAELETEWHIMPITWVKKFANNAQQLAAISPDDFVEVSEMVVGKDDRKQVMALADTTCTFPHLGEKRVVVLQTNQENRLGIYTAAPHPAQTSLDDQNAISTIGLLNAMRFKQRIENLFKVDKHEMGGDNLPSQRTYPAQLTIPYDTNEARQHLEQAQTRLLKYDYQMAEQQTLCDEDRLDKHQFNYLTKRSQRLQRKAQREVDTLCQELESVQADDAGQTYLTTETICLDVRKLTLLNLFKQHARIALKLVARQLGLDEANPTRLRRSFLAFGSHVQFDHEQKLITVHAKSFPRKSMHQAYEQYCASMWDIPIILQRNGVSYRVRFSC
ncbi:MAG: hypothetical protein GY774_31540 [Planctomycetes bacterium]|nr:hypothetical protein [Planctomycetota bacterium]